MQICSTINVILIRGRLAIVLTKEMPRFGYLIQKRKRITLNQNAVIPVLLGIPGVAVLFASQRLGMSQIWA